MATPQAGLQITDPQAYREKLFQLVGEQEPLDVMTRTADQLDEIVRKYPAAVLRARPFEEKWTPNEIIGHLTDSEWVYGYRLRLILCEENPTILGMDQNLWVKGERHNERAPAAHAEMFRTMREYNLVLWRQVKPEDLKRTGMHNERGPESLGLLLRMLAGHDLSHVGQIHRYIEAMEKSG
jgi:DinB superfamily